MAVKTKNAEILDKIGHSDKILVGLGEEFDDIRSLRQVPEYEKGSGILKNAGYDWLIPAWNEFWRQRQGDSHIVSALEKLAVLLEGKDIFVVSTSINGRIAESGLRTVMPCGSLEKKQCAEGCVGTLQDITEKDHLRLWQGFELLADKSSTCDGDVQKLFGLGKCPECGKSLVLNTVYTKNYNENGYLEQWNQYTTWLQGTLHHSLLVLELGVGMQFPSVIRWPFEKAAFFNHKAFFGRVNEKLYQLTEELSGKGCGISINAIDWLNQL